MTYGREYRTLRLDHEERERRTRQRPFTSFVAWLEERVRLMLLTNADAVSQDLVDLSRPPSNRIGECDAMWAYGSHYRCLNEDDDNNFVSFDPGVTVVIKTWCRLSARDRHPFEAELKYVGVFRKVIQVRHGDTLRTVMQCFWIRPNLEGIPTMRRDANGMWLAKYWSRQQPEREPYVFPYNMKQVCRTARAYSVLRPPWVLKLYTIFS